MQALLDIPLPLRLAALFVVGAAAASLGNAAIYAWAWNARRVSPWQPAPEGVAPRGWADRLPVFGWWRLRRDATQLGRLFWVRPLLIEVGFGLLVAALYWWEVDRLGLIGGQVDELLLRAGMQPPEIDPRPLAWPLHAVFALHAAAAWLMLVASFVDIDEKSIPSSLTDYGTLAFLLAALAFPAAGLPDVVESAAEPRFSVPLLEPQGTPILGPEGEPLYVQPMHTAAPNHAWPDHSHPALLAGLGCYWLWCFAVIPRVWRGRRGAPFALGLIAAHVWRGVRTTPLREAVIAGTLVIAMAWWTGGAHWSGLLTALVGMAASGGIVWGVRLIGAAALRREAMGFGDVMLMMMLGTVLGWQASLFVFFLAPFAAVVIAVANLLINRDDEIPYGPYLCLATLALFFLWAPLWNHTELVFSLGWLVPVATVVCLVLLGVLLGIWQVIKQLLFGRSQD
ncbi:Type IV leader peptidase family protein [Pirellulimonas nuda]|uniref:Type IV leader peptidase family protein n=1 Tax=Pirellulimonas nuda TaxID=2528009 RepID=A0A518D9C9_9BACT|nr:A24 family peptidase [Pirellulimonas nuda]QDU88070.1 Type IV leader peptidase family protein [Pirellulimonas nuda]